MGDSIEFLLLGTHSNTRRSSYSISESEYAVLNVVCRKPETPSRLFTREWPFYYRLGSTNLERKEALSRFEEACSRLSLFYKVGQDGHTVSDSGFSVQTSIGFIRLGE
ncbi:MAG: hypothetical protein RLZZ345_159 [Actinomycetota bacterium]|jgi:hypothetical protein